MSPNPQSSYQQVETDAEIPAMKDERRALWRGAVEQELQSLVQEASQIRKAITESKTLTKKTYFNKKFKKCQAQVLQMVGTLQRLQSTEAPAQIVPNDTSIVNE